ncbi:MAG TPA: hypothetical protein VFV43_04705 [Limnobacter sp.]|nr:hypothetical protein [Limnobacter sp.]
MQATNLVLAEQLLPDLGRATLLSAHCLDRVSYCARLHLNAYQSNCLSQWLNMRWSVPALKGSSLVFGEDARLVVQVPFFITQAKTNATERAGIQFELWRESLQKEMAQYLQAHA